MDCEPDRLSGLQDDLILKILSFVGLKDALGASVLSPRWRFLWTSIPHLTFSSEDFSSVDKFSDFVTHVLSRRSNHLFSLNLYVVGKDAHDVALRIMNHAFCLNVQQLNVTCLPENHDRVAISVSRAQTLKHLSLSRARGRYRLPHITLAFTQELSSLTTLCLNRITLYDGFCSNCPNLEKLSMSCCNITGSKIFNICHPRLSNLTVQDTNFRASTVNVVTPQLKNLNILRYFGSFQISAPNLASLLFKGPAPVMFSTDGFHSLEKAEISMHNSVIRIHAPTIISLLQRFHNVKYLSLSVEIIQVLNSSVELISRQPSPLANLTSLKILPKSYCYATCHEHTRVIMSTEVKNYLLNSSPKATMTEVLREQCCDITAGVVPYYMG